MKTLNFPAKAAYARTLTEEQLAYAIFDCRRCIARDINPDYYRDAISVYKLEQDRRPSSRPLKRRKIASNMYEQITRFFMLYIRQSR